MRAFREDHKSRIENDDIQPNSVERKLRTVYTFYRLMDLAIPLNENSEERATMVAPTELVRHFPITTAKVESRFGKASLVWSDSEFQEGANAKRPTPDMDQVAEILTALRSRHDRMATADPGYVPTAESRVVAERDWLMARAQAEAGLRAMEVVRFRVQDVWETFRDEGLVLGSGPESLISADDETKQRIRDHLNVLQQRRRHTYVRVTGKRRKVRYAAMSVDFLRDLVEIGVWNVHRYFSDKLQQSGANHFPDEIFLSTETYEPLKEKSVGKIMKQAFKEAGVPGSGHRLRAHYGTFLAASLWEDAMTRNGFTFSQAVLNTVLDELADAMGHKFVTTTIRHYLDMAILRYYGFSNRKKFKAFMQIWNSIADGYSELSKAAIETITKFSKALTTTPDDRLRQVVELALARPDLNPGQQNVPSAVEPPVKLAYSSDKPDKPSK
jgi:integrase